MAPDVVATNTSEALDSSSPFILHASDSPRMTLLNSTFDGKRYGGWKRSVLIAFSAKNKLGFIDGTCQAPTVGSANHKLWGRCNDMANGAKLYHLQKELNDLVQGSSDVAGYFTKMKLLWDELDTMDNNFVCSCTCTCVRSNILMQSPLPNVNHAYSLLIQDEKQREGYVSSYFPVDSSIFMAAQQKNPGPNRSQVTLLTSATES
ncbi:hypothetical protein KY285_024391 [Solanum tuberosum]|nr:hypothetical protein KY285_024391 [Solanum tuberosum]